MTQTPILLEENMKEGIGIIKYKFFYEDNIELLAGSPYPIKTTENNDDNTSNLERQTFLKITPKGDKTY